MEKWKATIERHEKIEDSKTKEEKVKEMQLYLLFTSAIAFSFGLSLYLIGHNFSAFFIFFSFILILGVIGTFVLIRLYQLESKVAERYKAAQ